MKLSVIIVNYNVKYYLEQCLRSVQKALCGIDAEVIVIDNHSHDGSIEYLSPRFPDYTFISSNHNLGFARGLCRHFPNSRRFGKYYMSYLSWDRPEQIEIVSGAFCMLRRKALEEVGLLDEDYFMYGEDIDLSYRLLKAGWANWYVPVRVLHYKGESTQKSSFRYVHVFYEAMLIFFRKHFGHLSILLTFPVQLAIYTKASLALIPMVLRKIRRSLGFVDKTFKSDPLYIFYIASQHRKPCELLIRRKGLRAKIFDTDTTIPEDMFDVSGTNRQYIAFDMSSFSYNDVLGFFSQHRHSGAVMAMYYPDEGIVITDTDVLKGQPVTEGLK